MSRIFDSQKVNKKISELLQAHIKKHPDEEQEIMLIQATIQNEMETETRHITLPPFIKQRFLYALAGHYVYRDERRDWFFYQAIMQIIPIPEVDKIIQRKYGDNYHKLQIRLQNYGSILNDIRTDLDRLQENPKDTKKYLYHLTRVHRQATRLPAINKELNQLFTIICLYTNLGTMTVPQPPIQMFRHAYQKVEYPDDPHKKTTPTPGDTGGET